MRLLYFTESYPFGLGEEWKTNELFILAKYFEEIKVVPFHFGGNKDPIELPAQNISVSKPLFNSIPITSWFSWIALTLRRPLLVTKEFLSASFNGRGAFANFRQSCAKIEALLSHEVIHQLSESSYDVGYFFWGRNTVEITAIQTLPFPCAVRLHGYDLYKQRWANGYIPFHKMILKNADLVLAISNLGKEYIEKVWKVDRTKIAVSRLGTRSEGMSLISKDNIIRIISCSSIVPVKRLDRIFSILKELRGYRIKWIHIGGGDELENFRTRANEDFEGSSLEFIGPVPAEKVKSFYVNKQVDLFINTSESEGVPVSIMEALSAGIPVIAPNIGGVSEIVNNTNGWLVSLNSVVNEVVAAIIEYEQMSDNAKELKRKAAYRMYEENYDAYKNAQELVGHLSALIS